MYIYVELICHCRLTIYKPVLPQSTTSGAAAQQVPAMLGIFNSTTWAKQSGAYGHTQNEARVETGIGTDGQSGQCGRQAGKRKRFRGGVGIGIPW